MGQSVQNHIYIYTDRTGLRRQTEQTSDAENRGTLPLEYLPQNYTSTLQCCFFIPITEQLRIVFCIYLTSAAIRFWLPRDRERQMVRQSELRLFFQGTGLSRRRGNVPFPTWSHRSP